VDRADPEGDLKPRLGGAGERRLFARTLPSLEAELSLAGDAAQHARVLRLAAGDEVQLFDGLGSSARARIVQLGKGVLRCIGIEAPVHVARAADVVLIQCLPKAGKLDDIVRMTTELGVAQIALAVSEHCVTRASRDADHKLERLERIAQEAARQAEQPYVPAISAPRPLAEVLARAPKDVYRAVCLERSSAPFPRELRERACWLVIGPEGGFSARDRSELAAANFHPIALGGSILRTETAAVVGVALALERFGRGR
jgi:16S rRNA (uracil1498-N3)-methyltransferase